MEALGIVPRGIAGARLRRFTEDDYYAMAEAGILQPDERTELIDGLVLTKHSPDAPHGVCLRRFTVDEYHTMRNMGILGCDDHTELIEGLVLNGPSAGSH